MSDPENAQIEALLEYVKRSRGFDFTGYKRSTLVRRVGKRQQELGIDGFGNYQDYLEVHAEEFAILFNTILINVTSFFRDRPAWDFLASEVISRIAATKSSDEPIRVWSAGCSTGEEAYSVAILLAEALGPDNFCQRVKIYATDVDEAALIQARQAVYNAKDLKELSAELRDRYFEPVGTRYAFRTRLRRSVIFGRNDLVQDAPISHLDLLLCRNTLMYFNAETQSRILSRLHFALNEGGFLFLGKAETLLTRTNLFTPIDLRYRIFAQVPRVPLRDRLLVPAQAAGGPEASSRPSRELRLRDEAFETAPVSQVVVDAAGCVLMTTLEARALFGLSAMDSGRRFEELELSHRPVELRSLIEQAYAQCRSISLTKVEHRTPHGETYYLDVQVTPLLENASPLGVSITFHNVTRHSQLQVELERANRELEAAREVLQSTNEELETTNEELQSTNEELETTNEELQSTNEELETMNEELQSTNQELQTINEELQQRNEEINRLTSYLESILAGLRTAVVVVDSRLAVQLWNDRASDLWGLQPHEVQGQPLLSLDVGLPVERLLGPLRACLAGESNNEHVTLDATNRRGKAIKCRVTCTRLLASDREISGAILLMEEHDA